MSTAGHHELRRTITGDKLLAGVLLKKSDHVKQWRPRYFVLRTDGLLLYYLPKADPLLSPPRGALPMTGCTVRKSQDTSSGHFGFTIVHPWMRPWILAAATAAERERWMESIREFLPSPDE